MNYKAAAQAIHHERVEIWIALGKPWSEEDSYVFKSRQLGYGPSEAYRMAMNMVFPKTGWTEFHHEEALLRYQIVNLRMLGNQTRTFYQFSTDGLKHQFTDQWNAHSQN
jgi:hypothetical protein